MSFDVPESFNGTLRLMAVAATPTAMGVAQASSVIRGPYVVSPNTPTFAAPHDSLVVTAAIANNVEGSGDKASVTVELAPNASFTVKGPLDADAQHPRGARGRGLLRGDGHRGTRRRRAALPRFRIRNRK